MTLLEIVESVAKKADGHSESNRRAARLPNVGEQEHSEFDQHTLK